MTQATCEKTWEGKNVCTNTSQVNTQTPIPTHKVSSVLYTGPLRNHILIKPRVLCLDSKPLEGSAAVINDPAEEVQSQVRLAGHLQVPTGLQSSKRGANSQLVQKLCCELCLNLRTCETTTAEIAQSFASKYFLLEVFQTEAVEFFRKA